MSDETKDNIQSNEEVINELTKEVEEQFTLKNDNVIEPTTEFIRDAPEDFDKSDNEDEQSKTKNDPKQEDDYIDEVALKDAEVTLTDEEREERHKQSLELKKQGNEEFKTGKYLESVFTYTEALRLCPLKYESDRAVFYANRGASKIQVDRIPSAIDDCTKAIELNDKYVRAYMRRAKLYEETDKLDESLKDYETISVLDPGNIESVKAQQRLPPLIAERNEKLKTEMFGKLKDLGNMFLRPFGMSTDNFQLNQDPNTGGYSINFQQNPPQS
ncbi:unnamed protein product [Brassicogethes aeneus]|uniref:Tetratricopeptide repeat protein 1 n=1 Tax=Brassicogethes aeneus TaxID=1431903 RepID=A0A9P0FG16_BRAAE|nr:unnamed protein product [Brassicogethes aeneus]